MRRFVFSKIKTKVAELQQSNLVYQISCRDCTAVYIGETGQKLNNRIMRHRNDVKKYDTNVELYKKTR